MPLPPNEGVKDMPLHSLPLAAHQTLVKYYTSLVLRMYPYLSMNHLGNTIDLVSLGGRWSVPRALSLGHFPHVLLPKVMILVQLIEEYPSDQYPVTENFVISSFPNIP